MCSVGVKFGKLGPVSSKSPKPGLSVGLASSSIEHTGLFFYAQEVFRAVRYPVTAHT